MPFDLEVNILLILIFLGFLAAFIDSVVGGGGLISLPALMFVGLPPPSAAVATNKLAGTIGSLTSTITFYRSGKLASKAVYKLFPFVFIGSARCMDCPSYGPKRSKAANARHASSCGYLYYFQKRLG